MHRKSSRRWWTSDTMFNSKLILQLILLLFISQSVCSDNYNNIEDKIRISLNCKNADCQLGQISVQGSPAVVVKNNNRKYPVYEKQSANNNDNNHNFNNRVSNSQINYNNFNNIVSNTQNNNNYNQNDFNNKVSKTQNNNNYNQNNNNIINNNNVNNANNNYQVPNSNSNYYNSYKNTVAITPIQEHISYLNNLTVSSFQPQYSTLVKDNYNDNYNQDSSAPYFERVTNYYQPNETVSSWEPYEETSETNQIKDKEDYFPHYSDILKHIPNFNGEINLETSGLKLVVIVVSIWYLVIAVLVHSNFLQTEFSKCDGGDHGGPGFDLPLSHINAAPERLPYVPHGDSDLQKSVFDMFQSSDYSSDESSIEMPDLSRISSMCSKDAFYYGMNKNHMMAVEMVMDIFMNQPGPHEMMSMAKGMLHSPEMNSKVWYEGLMRACHERHDMGGMVMPGPMDAMPDNFLPGHAFDEARSLRDGRFRNNKNLRSHKKEKKQKCVRVDGSVGVDNGIENLLWYFREDVMVNSHHWYWHLSYPIRSKTPRDRRGELFYYVHKSMLNRYNFERMSNGLDIVQPIEAYRGAPIELGYHAHLTETNSGMDWTDRRPGIPFTDIMHQQNAETPLEIVIDEWVETGNRVIRAVKKGYFITRKGTKLITPSYGGIDIVGNALESSDLSINPEYYGVDGYHNQGHQIIANLEDPYYELRLPPGPMGDPSTAMRDTVFYLWHTNVNNIFEKYKSMLKPYQPIGGEWPLLWKGVEVKEIKVISKEGVNDLSTFFSKKKFELSLGLSLLRRGEDVDEELDHLKVCTKHLDHSEFEYEIVVDRKPCAKNHLNAATVRIFLAPKFDQYGRKFTMKEQRGLFVHLDLFTTKLNVGRNIIKRRSIDSALTIPYSKSLRQLQTELENPSSPYCGCGWPHHLLLPKGSSDGMPFDLFVMVTNADHDIVEDHSSPLGGGCQSAPLYCGVPNGKYPDARPMGYPFDRELYKIAPGCHGFSIWSKLCTLFSFHWRPPLYLEEYMAGISNMAATQVVITHKH